MGGGVDQVCNLYSVTKGQAAIVALTRAMRDTTGNLPPMPGVFPDYLAPIVRRLKEFPLAAFGRRCQARLRLRRRPLPITTCRGRPGR